MAEGYDQLWKGAWSEAATRGPGFRSRYHLLLELMSDAGVAGRVLEVGAGEGHFLKLVRQRFPWLELSAQEPAAGAAEALRGLGFLEAVFSEDIPAPDGTTGHAGFHAIVCSEVLEHIEDHGAALDRMVAILRPGGRLFLTVPLRKEAWTPVDDAVGHQRRYEPGELAGMCRDRGLLVEADLRLGWPLYNAYYKVLGRKPPSEAVERGRGRLGAAASELLARAFVAEQRLKTPWGIRGAVVASKPLPRGSRGR